MNRQQIINATACPICSAPAGQRCTKKGKPKKTVHSLRVKYAANGHKMTPFEIDQAKNKRASAHSARAAKKTGASFYSSWEWKKLRFQTFERLGRRCMCCGWSPDQGGKGHLCVDHIKPRSKFPSLELEPTNMQVLCNSCNMGKSNTSTTRFEPYEDGARSWMDDAFSATIQ